MREKELIDSITLYQSPVKLKTPFIISLGKLEFADNFIVEIKTKSGLTGYGECSPFTTIHGETGSTCMSIGELIAPFFIGKDALELEQNSILMDRIVYGNHSVKSAFDIAMYDLASQQAGVPLYRFLGGKKKKLFTDYTVSLNDADQMSADAKQIVANGFPFVKIELGGKPEDDKLRMKKIVEAIGNEVPLRLDANQGWTVETAIDLLKTFSAYNIQHCEEPLPRHQFLDLGEVRKNNSGIPIMADESCCDHHDAERLIRLKSCDRFNVKLGKSAGITKAMKILRLAENAEMPVQIGGFLESRLGFTAAAHVALSSSAVEFVDFDTPMMLSEDEIEGGIVYGPNGLVEVSDNPGLGAKPSTTWLSSLKKQVIEKSV